MITFDFAAWKWTRSDKYAAVDWCFVCCIYRHRHHIVAISITAVTNPLGHADTRKRKSRAQPKPYLTWMNLVKCYYRLALNVLVTVIGCPCPLMPTSHCDIFVRKSFSLMFRKKVCSNQFLSMFIYRAYLNNQFGGWASMAHVAYF